MPLYAFKCTNCDTEFEKLMSIRQRYDGETDIVCPECGCIENTPILNKTSFSLKGGGWYKDGYTSPKLK